MKEEAYPEECAIVDLAQPQKLQDLPAFRMHVIDTPDSDHKCQLAFRLYIIAIVCLSLSPQPNEVCFLHTYLGTLLPEQQENLEKQIRCGSAKHLSKVGFCVRKHERFQG